MSLSNQPYQAAHMDEVIQFRLTAKDKENLMQAASIQGINHSAYIRTHLMECVHKDLQHFSQENTIILSEDEWDQFVKVMESPPLPNKALKRAFTDFRKKIYPVM